MSLLRTMGRMGLSTIFVSSGLNGLQNPGYAASVASEAGLPEPELAETIHHATNVVAGAAMALGIMPRFAATALLGNLVPTTVLAHNPADAPDEEARQAQSVHMLKNISLMGALVMVAAAATDDDGDDADAAIEQPADDEPRSSST